MVSSSVQIVVAGLGLFLAGLIVFFVTEPVSVVSSVLFTSAVITMMGAIIILAFGA